jgi:hypothetical protein
MDAPDEFDLDIKVSVSDPIGTGNVEHATEQTCTCTIGICPTDYPYTCAVTCAPNTSCNPTCDRGC